MISFIENLHRRREFVESFTQIDESPQIISAVFKDLETSEENKNTLKDLQRLSRKEILKETSTYKIEIFYRHTNTIVVLWDKKDSKIKYYVDTYLFGKIWAAQVKLWRDKKYSPTRGLPQKILFDVLLPKYHMVVTDEQQTEEGKRFWLSVIESAPRNKYLVGIIDLTSGITYKITSPEEIKKNIKSIWSSKDKLVFIAETGYVK